MKHLSQFSEQDPSKKLASGGLYHNETDLFGHLPGAGSAGKSKHGGRNTWFRKIDKLQPQESCSGSRKTCMALAWKLSIGATNAIRNMLRTIGRDPPRSRVFGLEVGLVNMETTASMPMILLD